jgi:hypothetical protein
VNRHKRQADLAGTAVMPRAQGQIFAATFQRIDEPVYALLF